MNANLFQVIQVHSIILSVVAHLPNSKTCCSFIHLVDLAFIHSFILLSLHSFTTRNNLSCEPPHSVRSFPGRYSQVSACGGRLVNCLDSHPNLHMSSTSQTSPRCQSPSRTVYRYLCCTNKIQQNWRLSATVQGLAEY